MTGRYQKAHGLASTLTADATRLENKLQDVVKKLASTEERSKALAIEKTEIEAAAQAYKDEKNRKWYERDFRVLQNLICLHGAQVWWRLSNTRITNQMSTWPRSRT